MGDVQSGMPSAIILVYLKNILEAFFIPKSQVRLEAMNVIQLVLKQGLIHPAQCVPYLIAVCTDTEAVVRLKSEQQLQDIEKKHPGFIHMKALQGIKMCYRLQEIIQREEEGNLVRGLRNPDDNSASLNAFLYNILRANRQHRRALLLSLLNLMDDSARINLPEQVYIVDNLAFFNYQTQDEPLFIIHQIDIIVSVSGSNLMQSFREKLAGPSSRSSRMAFPNAGAVTENGVSDNTNFFDDDDDDKESLLERLPADISPMQEILWIAQGCILLLYLKQHLKDMYGFTDSKIQNYSPSEAAKVYEKPLPKKTLVKFNPECVLNILREKKNPVEKTELEEREKLIEDYLSFKDLMLSVDPPDDDDSDDNKSTGRKSPVTFTIKRTEGAGGDAGTTNHIDEDGEESKQDIDGAVIEVEEDGESHSESSRPRIPPVIISASKLQTPNREKDKKKGSLVRTIRLPGASQLQASANKSPVHSIASHTPSSRSHHRTPSSHSKHKKDKKKKRRKYGSDSDDEDDSDYEPC